VHKPVTDFNQIQLGQRVRVTLVEDFVVYVNGDKTRRKVLHPAGTVWEGIVTRTDDEGGFVLRLDDGSQRCMWFFNSGQKITILSSPAEPAPA
jgi:hypothetical protein